MSRQHYVLRALALVSLAVNADARAADYESGFYAGFGVGEVNDKVDGFDSHGVGFKIYGGYALSKYFAAEAAYMDAGQMEDTVDGVDVDIEADGLIVAAVAKLPLGEALSLFAKLGYTFYDEKVRATQGNFSLSDKNSDEDLLYGAGAELDLGRRFQLRAEYEIVDVANADFNVLSAGVVFRF
jgi:OmpA-OmpF porin, OOP family